MNKVLQINSSITGDNSVSRELSNEIVERLAQASGGIELVERDFSKQPIPSMLKAWVDHVARAGVTFQYTDTGPVGLLSGKKAYLVGALGGKHEAGGSDFMRPYMKLILNFVGITDIEFISADGLSMGDEPRAAGLAAARKAISQIAA